MRINLEIKTLISGKVDLLCTIQIQCSCLNVKPLVALTNMQFFLNSRLLKSICSHVFCVFLIFNFYNVLHEYKLVIFPLFLQNKIFLPLRE